MENPLFEKKTKDIDGVTYDVVLFPAGRGFELLFDLKAVMGDSIGALFGGNVETAITRVGGNLGKTEVLNVVLRLMEFTFVAGRTQGIDRAFFDSHFAGKYGHLLKVLMFVVEVNFADFFDECRNAILGAVDKFNEMMKRAGAVGAVDSLFPNPSGENG